MKATQKHNKEANLNKGNLTLQHQTFFELYVTLKSYSVHGEACSIDSQWVTFDGTFSPLNTHVYYNLSIFKNQNLCCKIVPAQIRLSIVTQI